MTLHQATFSGVQKADSALNFPLEMYFFAHLCTANMDIPLFIAQFAPLPICLYTHLPHSTEMQANMWARLRESSTHQGASHAT